MKKILLFLGLLMLLFVSTACTKQNTSLEESVDVSEGVINQGNSEEIDENQVIEKDTFSVTVPDGWQENVPQAGYLLDMSNYGGEVDTDNGVFRSNFQLSYEDLKGQSFSDRFEELKDKAQDRFPDSQIAEREKVLTARQRFFIFEVPFIEDGIEYRFFQFLIAGKNVTEESRAKDAWLLEYTTLKDMAGAEIPVVYEIVNSLKF